MTIAELAREFGLTPQAIYKRAKQGNIRLSELKAEDGKSLTPEGLSILSDLMEFKRVDNCLETETPKVVKRDDRVLNELKAELNELKEENTELKIRVAELKKEAEAKGEMINTLRDQLTFMQQLQAVTLQRIPTERPTIWQRITGRVKKEGRSIDAE